MLNRVTQEVSTVSTATAKRLISASQFVGKYGDLKGYELVLGHLRRLTMPGIDHSGIEVNISSMLHAFVKEKGLGRVLGGEALIRTKRNPDSYRAADVAFVSYKLLPKSKPRPKGPLEFGPELVVEILSPTDRPKAVRLKTEDYLAAGVTAVMIVDPAMESVAVYRDDEWPQQFHNGDKVTLPDVLPGFSAPVKAFFE